MHETQYVVVPDRRLIHNSNSPTKVLLGNNIPQRPRVGEARAGTMEVMLHHPHAVPSRALSQETPECEL